MNTLLRSIPFIVVIALNVFAEASRFKINMLSPFLLAGGAVLLLNVLLLLLLKKKDYFVFGISGVAIMGISTVFVFPAIGHFYIQHIIEGLYLGLFLMASIPLLMGIKPFCFSISEKQYPAVIVNSKGFLKLNNLMSGLWAALFALCILLTAITYADDAAIQTVISTLIPIVMLLSIGIPLNKYLPTYLMQNAEAEPIHFESFAEALEAMPYGMNKELAQDIDTVIQFELTGEEAGINHIIIQNQHCTVVEGAHSKPKTTIKADSQLWLDVTNNAISGDKAFLNKLFEVEGDATILLLFSDLK